MISDRKPIGDPQELDPFPPESAAAHLEAMGKGINDIDVVVQGLLGRIPPSKPWQRTLLTQLRDADRLVEILWLQIALGRDGAELHEAARNLRQALETANVQIIGGRADGWTRNALLVAYRNAKLICSLLAP